MTAHFPDPSKSEQTRTRILARVIEEPGCPTLELSDDLGLSEASVRKHLLVLLALGLVSTREVRNRRGVRLAIWRAVT